MKKFTSLLLLAGLIACPPPLVRADGTNGTNAPAQAPVKPYPIKTCIVSGEKLGEMGDPVHIVFEGQEIKFCCEDCVAKFKKNPKKFLKKLDEASQKQTKS